MYAGHTTLPWPDEPHLQLWHACTLLREHRGDSHAIALAAASVDPVQCQVVMAARGHGNKETLQSIRGWDDAEWDGAVQALQAGETGPATQALLHAYNSIPNGKRAEVKDGKVVSKARLTVVMNGVKVQDNSEYIGPSSHRVNPPYKKHDDKLPIGLQFHGGSVLMRQRRDAACTAN